jgi:quinoprotein glucose dehydrogenase
MYKNNLNLSHLIRVVQLSLASKIVSIIILVLIFNGCNKTALHANSGKPAGDKTYKVWNQYGGGADQSKYVELNQITKENVSKLEQVWTYSTNDNVATYKFNPIVVDNIMYVIAKNNSLVALDATIGKELWIHANLNVASKRGINYWESNDRKDRRLIFCINNTLQEIDALTGKSILTFGTNGYVDLKQGLGRDPSTLSRVTSTSPGAIFGDLILLGMSPGENLFSPPGHLRAYNVITGKMEWIFHTVPQPGEFGYETWPKDAYKYIGGVNTWGEISVDTKRGIAYFPMGSPTTDYYGADRHGNGIYGNCILALDARTGKRLWHFQTVHHDLWDFDLASAPQLVTVTHNGKKVDAVAQASKHGFLFVFNRVTGEPLWPIEERSVHQSTIPGEQSSPTQPFPTVVPPFSRQVFTVNDVSPLLSTEQQEVWKKRVAAAKSELFEPLSDKHETITMPGANGGAIFGNTAADPKKGYVFVSYQDKPSFYSLKKDEPSTLRVPISADETIRAQAAYVQNCQVCHGAEKTGGIGPSLVNINNRVPFTSFQSVVGVGRGQMPSFLHLGDQTVTDLYKYLSSFPAAGANGRSGGQRGGAGNILAMPEGPVVGSGGAPIPQQPNGSGFGSGTLNKPNGGYPEGVTPPKERYSDASGYGMQNPTVIAAPWSSIAMYDLNTGKIKWTRALGNDDKIPGAKDTGLPAGSQYKGMVITSTGLVFATCLDGRIYVYDEDNGNILWSVKLPRVPEGIPAMYESNGRQYLVVCAAAISTDKSKSDGEVPRGYFVFALPAKKSSTK